MSWYERARHFCSERALGFTITVALMIGACANPVPPRGGPEDTTPPAIVGTQPVQDTVNVATTTDVLRMEFSEYVERSTLSRSLSVTPTFERPLQFDWSGRAVEIEFPEPLRDSTTYIFTFDTNLRDAHGVSPETPITVAFSTGPRINRGQIRGRVVGAGQGQPKKQVDVFAYAVPPSATSLKRPLPDRPSYRTQTGEDGTFEFDYMREQPYYVVALRDNNRNRQPDGLEPYAVPPRFGLLADSTGAEVPVPWLFTRTDTIAPELQRVQSLSRERFRVSFDEPVNLQSRTPSRWAPRDSATGNRADVRSVYSSPGRSTDVVVRTDPLRDTRYELVLDSSVVVDTVGIGVDPDTARFGVNARPDTTSTRFRRFLPAEAPQDTLNAHPLLPDVHPGIRFNQAPDSTVLRRAVRVRDTTGERRAFSLTTEDGTGYWIQTEPPLAPGELLDVSVRANQFSGRDTTYEQRYRRVTSQTLGELAGRVVLADTARQLERASSDTSSGHGGFSRDSLLAGVLIKVELTTAESSIPVDPRGLTTAPGSTFVFEELPEGQFRFRAYLDRNGNGHWDGGQLLPYQPAEPVTWLEEPVDARPRWTTELPLPLRIPVLAPERRTRRPLPKDTSQTESGRGLEP